MIRNHDRFGANPSVEDPSGPRSTAPSGGPPALVVEPPVVTPTTRVLARSPFWHRVALGAILALAAFLDFFRLWDDGDGNLYYAAAVKSMLESLHNAFFVSFDPGGFVSVDKPPLDLWLQTASAAVFGFRGFSLLLPQAIAGVLSVALLYHLVQRAFGRPAGLLAALTLAVTPISVATNRNNTMDSLLVLTSLLATWAVIRAAETGRLRWLVLGGVLVGLGFEIKMLEVFLVVPALALVYLVAAPLSWRRRLAYLGVAGIVLAVVSLAWPVAVDLTPANLRPYVGSSTTNSELELIVGHNGLQRLLPRAFGRGGDAFGRPSSGTTPAPPSLSSSGSPGGAIRDGRGLPNGARDLAAQFGFGFGPRGPQRFVSPQLSGQISWLLPLALLGLAAVGWQSRRRDLGSRQAQGLILWGAWLITQGIFFSVASMFEAYYLVMLAPAIAALVGIGVVGLSRGYRRPGWPGWALPISLLATALFEAWVLATPPTWLPWLGPVVVVGCLLVAAILAVVRCSQARIRDRAAVAAIVLGVATVLVAPSLWALVPVFHVDAARPIAGPALLDTSGFGGGMLATTPRADPKLLDYLLKNQGDAQYLVATLNANTAAPIILDTGRPVMALGGFMGSDPILTPKELADLVDNGTVRYFLLPSRGFGQTSLESWVTTNCSTVPSRLWQSSSESSGQATGGRGFDGGGVQNLYACTASPAHAAGSAAGSR